jgi:pre-mRNA 3'-end-processing factor FIP1
MDVDEDDDFYAPEEGATTSTEAKNEDVPRPDAKPEPEDEDLEEGEEEDEAGSEGSDSVWFDIEMLQEYS